MSPNDDQAASRQHISKTGHDACTLHRLRRVANKTVRIGREVVNEDTDAADYRLTARNCQRGAV